jgi:hypothetical protein
MTYLRPLAIPAAALALTAVAQSADARTRRPVNAVWVTAPGPALQAAAGTSVPARVVPAQPAIPLPLAGWVTPGEQAAAPGGRQPAAAGLTGTVAAGRPTSPTARGPPG